jgi:hypothetical protein
VKADEIKWSGIEQALASLEKDGKVSKEDLLNYLRNEGRVRFEEVTMGGVKKVWTQQEIDALEKTAQRTQSWDAYEQAVLEFEDQQLGSNANQTGNETKFAQYVLPGGENYREVVLAMATGVDITKFKNAEEQAERDVKEAQRWLTRMRREQPNNKQIIARREGEVAAAHKRMKAAQSAYADAKEREKIEGPAYTSSHFPDTPNYVAHMRTNERTLDDGSEGLFVEEFQSDRHQAGRKQGYREDNNEAQMLQEYLDAKGKKRIDLERELKTQYPEWKQQYSKFESFAKNKQSLILDQQSGRIADAPFRTTWPIQLFKRALRDAVDGGKDWIGWTVGDTQNERFDLSKQVDSISVPMVNADGSRSVRIDPKDGTSFKMMVDSNGIVNGYQSADQFTGKRLDEVVGKDMADKIIALESPANFEGNDLKVGGSGMRGFYDTMLPKEVGKYVKQFGGKVEKAEIDIREPASEAWYKEPTDNDYKPIWKVNITPEMRKISQTGQMRFMPEGDNAPKQQKTTAKKQPSELSAVSRMAVVNDDEEQSRRKTRRSTAKGNASAIANAAKLK